MSKKAFDKFINKPIAGAKKKEKLRQEKKVERRARRAAIEESKRKRYERESGIRSQSTTDNQQSYSANRNDKIKTERTSSYPKKNLSTNDTKNIHPPKRKIAVEELKRKGKPETRNDKSETRNVKRETRNEKQETRNEKPET